MKKSIILILLMGMVMATSFSLTLTKVATLPGYRSVDYFNGKFMFGEKNGNVSVYNENFEKIGSYKISDYPITVVGATMGMGGYDLFFGDSAGKIFRYTENFKYVGSLKPFNSSVWCIARPKIPGIPRFVVGSLKGIMIEFTPSELMNRSKKEGFAPVSVNDLNIENSNSSSQIWDMEYVSNDMNLNTVTIDGILTSFAENSFSFRQVAKENIDTLSYSTVTKDNNVYVGGNGKIVEYQADFSGISPWKKAKEIKINNTVYSMAFDTEGDLITGNEKGDLIIYNSNFNAIKTINISKTPIWLVRVFNTMTNEILIAIDNNGNVNIFKIK